MNILDRIHGPEDVKKLDMCALPGLCAEIRAFLIDAVSATGGHLASNLGVVELTVAIHRVFDTGRDRLVFDVGHQCYVHKILTGRREGFDTLRRYGGLAGFPKPSESGHDAFIAGHASNAVSVALGFARARTRLGDPAAVVALVGDGAMTGGLCYEGLSDAGASGERLVVILNDNGMAITPNVGGIARHLARLRLRPGYHRFKKAYKRLLNRVPGGRTLYRFNHTVKTAFKTAVLRASLFEEMGFTVTGPVDGHDLGKLIEVLSLAKESVAPVLVHVITEKGKGYPPAEKSPDRFHGVPAFDAASGVIPPGEASFSSVFGHALTALAHENPNIVSVTAAMEPGTGLSEFKRLYPNRFFDVGIAEGHAAAMAAGAAIRGLIPVFAVYSTFLQRAYDMLLHDVALSRAHVVIGVDRAGFVGDDGETHHGVFDVAMLRSVPGMTVFAPASFAELADMLAQAVRDVEGPVAVRYPRGGEGQYAEGGANATRLLRTGTDFTVVTYGISVNSALEAAELLSGHGISIDLIKLGVICPVDFAPIRASARKTRRVLVLEECVESGGVGQAVLSDLAANGVALQSAVLKNIGQAFVTHGDVQTLRRLCGIDGMSVADAILKECSHAEEKA